MNSNFRANISENIKPRPGLYIVSTPIGNLGDITLRALEILSGVDFIACEDTRVTEKLLSRYAIKASMIVYNEHTAVKARKRIINELEKNRSVALVSDAGTPLISDPGYKLVREVTEKNIYITPVPGASSLLAALTISGLPTDSFYFAGFLPTKTTGRKKSLSKISGIESTLVFFERGTRIADVLKDMAEVLGKRQAAIVREITKTFEETKRGDITELASFFEKEGPPKGEVVIVLSPAEKYEHNAEDIDAMLSKMLTKMSVKQAVAEIAKKLGLPRKQVYSRALEIKDHGKK